MCTTQRYLHHCRLLKISVKYCKLCTSLSGNLSEVFIFQLTLVVSLWIRTSYSINSKLEEIQHQCYNNIQQYIFDVHLIAIFSHIRWFIDVHFSVYGEWTVWTAWSTCTETCGGGNQRRTRTCQRTPDQLNCEPRGGGMQIRQCNTWECPSKWLHKLF